MGKKKLAKTIIKAGGELLLNDKTQKFLCGTYSDGTTRSLADVMNEEFLSPADREKWEIMKFERSRLVRPEMMVDNISMLSQLPKDVRKKSKKKKKKDKKKIKKDFYKHL